MAPGSTSGTTSRSRLVFAGAALAALLLVAGLVVVALSAFGLAGLSGSDDEGVHRAVCANDRGDAATIQDVIDASRAGDRIEIVGRCLVDRTIRLLGDRTYEGTSRPADPESASVLTQAPGTRMKALLASSGWSGNTSYVDNPVAIRRLALHGNGASATSGIVLRSWRSQVSDTLISGFGQDGILLSVLGADGRTSLRTTMVGGRIENNLLESNGRSGVYVEDEGNAITDWWLGDNQVADSGGDAIHLDDSAGWIISGNHLYGTGLDGIYANKLHQSSVTDNEIEDFGREAPAGSTHFGILALGDASDVISNNRISNSNGKLDPGGTFVFLRVTATGDCSVAVIGNVVRGPDPTVGTTVGLSYQQDDDGALTVASTGNLVSRVATPLAQDDGVQASAGY